MIRIIDLIEDLDVSDNANLNNKAQLSRLISQKEEHGIKVKEEIRVIWGDYFKKPQIDQFPEIHDLTHSIMLLCSKSCLLYTSPSPRDGLLSRMPSSA